MQKTALNIAKEKEILVSEVMIGKMYMIDLVISKLKVLKSHLGFLRYFANISWLFTEKFLRMVIGFFVSAWVARYLGPEKYGLLSYAQSFVGLFTAIATLGPDGIVVRELVYDIIL